MAKFTLEELYYGDKYNIMGNDKLWGYDKKDCVMTINEEEAEVVRIIFDLYANKGLGVRRISLALFDMG